MSVSVYPQPAQPAPGVQIQTQSGYPPPGYAPGYAPQAQTTVQYGYAPPPPVQQSHVVVLNQPTRVVPGTCRGCGMGTFRSSPTAFGICMAIFLFPIGLICLFTDMEKKCTTCGLTYR